MRITESDILGITGRRIGVVLSLGLLAMASGIATADSTDETEPPGTLEFIGKNLFSTANGTFHRWRIVEHAVDPAALTESFAVVEVDLASLDTGNGQRDDHLRTPDFFATETYPVATVRVHSARSSGHSEAGRPRYAAQFDIDLHGVKKTVKGEVVLVSESPLVLEGSLLVNRMDFGVGAAASRWNPMSVKAEIPIRFRVDL